MRSEHGITYVSRDGQRRWALDDFLARHPNPSELPRPERDVLASLLRFCLDGLAHLDAIEAFPALLPAQDVIPGRGPVAGNPEGSTE